MNEGFIVVFGTAILGMFGWVFNTNSKINVNETRINDLKELIEVKFDAVNLRLERIERALNGALRH